MAKSLVKNSIYNIIYKIVSVLYPLATVTYVSHVLMSERMGMVSYAQNIVSYFAVFAALGIPTYGIREIAVSRYNREKLSQIFWELFSINAVSTSVSIVTYIGLVVSIGRFHDLLLLYAVAGVQLILNYCNVDWFYQGLEEYRYISIRSIIVKIIALCLLPFLVKSADDYINYALIYCLAIAGNNIFNIVHIRKYVSKPQLKIEIKRHFKPISILLMVSLAVEIYAMIDTTMLGFYCDDSTVGCYTNSMKLTRMVTTTAAAIGAVLFPRLSIVYKENDRKKFNNLVNTGIKVMLMFAIPATVGLILLRQDIVLLLFGETFLDAVPMLAVLSIMIPIVVCNTLMGGQVLVTIGRESKYMRSVVLASIVNIILNSIFIPRFGATSAAIASLISESIVLVCYIIFSKDYVELKFNIRFFVSMMIPLILYIIVSIFVFSRLVIEPIYSLIINVVCCIVLYFGFGLLLKNEAMLIISNCVKRMIRRK